MESPPRWRSGSPPRDRPTAFRGSPSPPRRDARGTIIVPVIAKLHLGAVEVLRYLTRHWANDNSAARFDGKQHALTMAKTLHRSVLVIAGEDECEKHDPFFLPAVFARLLFEDEPKGDVLKFQNFCGLVLIALPRMTKSGMCRAPVNALEVLHAACGGLSGPGVATRSASPQRASSEAKRNSRLEAIAAVYRALSGGGGGAVVTFRLLRLLHQEGASTAAAFLCILYSRVACSVPATSPSGAHHLALHCRAKK